MLNLLSNLWRGRRPAPQDGISHMLRALGWLKWLSGGIFQAIIESNFS